MPGAKLLLAVASVAAVCAASPLQTQGRKIESEGSAKEALSLGQTSLAKGDLATAEREFRGAVRYYERVTPTSPALGKAYGSLGHIASSRDQLDIAAGWLTKAAGVFAKSAGSSEELAHCYEDLGDLYLRKGDPATGENWCRKALGILESKGVKTPLLIETYVSLGEFGIAKGDVVTAEKRLRQALEASQSLPDAPQLEGVYYDLGNLARYRSKLPEAEDWYGKAIEIQETKSPGSPDLAQSYSGLGVVIAMQGDLVGATTWFDKARRIQEAKAPRSLALARTYIYLGNVSDITGNQDQAAEFFGKAISIEKEKAPGSSDLAAAYGNLARISRRRGDLDAAERAFRGVVGVLESKVPRSLDVAVGYTNLATIEFARGDFDATQFWNKKALDILELKLPGSLNLALVYYQMGATASNQGDSLAAQNWLGKAESIYQAKAPSSLELADCFEARGANAFRMGNIGSAEDWFEKDLAIRKAKAPDSPDLAMTYQDLAGVAAERHNYAQAATWNDMSLSIRTRKVPGSLDLADCYDNRAVIEGRQGHFAEARRSFEQAYRIVESQRAKLLAPESRALLSKSHGSAVAEYVNALAALHDPAAVVNLLESSKSRAVAEALSSREVRLDTPQIRELGRQLDLAYARLRDAPDDKAAFISQQIDALLAQRRIAENLLRRTDPKLAALAYPRPLGLAEVQKALDPGSVCLHYMVGRDYTYVAAITRFRVSVHRIDVKESELEAATSSFLAGVSNGGQVRRSRDVSRVAPGSLKDGSRLFSWLIKPLSRELGKCNRLIVCPNGCLNGLPFAALPAYSGKYVADLWPLSTVPSVTTLVQIRGQKRLKARCPLFALGDPDYGTPGSPEPLPSSAQATPARRIREAARGLELQPLPNTRSEVETIAALYRSKPLLGKNATVSAVKAGAGRARIVHLACHGLLDSLEPTASGLALAPEKRNDGLLQAYEVMRDLHLSADLVVLSACQTGVGRNEGNEGVNGLTRAFEYAGARSVLVSLWNVDDKSTSTFMKLFYNALNAGRAKDVALQIAERGLRRINPSPYYWGPFTLCGDWR